MTHPLATDAAAPAVPAPRRAPRLDWPWWRRQGLAMRLVLMSLGVLMLVQLACYGVIRQSIDLNARRALEQRMTLGEQVWQHLLAQRAATLNQGAALLAADYGFREAVASKDQETLRSALDNHRLRIHASYAALLDTGLHLVATNDSMDDSLGLAIKRMAPQLAKRPGSGVVALVEGRALQFVMVPMKAPVLVGWVLMGFPVDRALVDDMQAVSGLAATVLAQPVSAPAALIVTSLGPMVDWRPLVQQLSDGDLMLGDERWLVGSVPLATGAEGRLMLRLAGSVDAAVAPYRSLQLLLAVISGLGVLLFGLSSRWMALRITKPLRRLARATERLGRGDYEQPLLYTGQGDEIDNLAQAFDQMRINIGSQQQEIRTLAFTDRLTELPNRLAFRQAVGEAMSLQTPQVGQSGQSGSGTGMLAVLMLDLDRFKHVNDVLGYASGDTLLLAVAQRLQQVVRDGDVVARLGGDEFALLLHDADVALAEQIAQRIATSFETPLTLDDQLVDMSAGIGIACWPQHAGDADLLLSHAEVAMYAAKRRTAGAQVYDPAVDTASAQTLSLLSELRRAIERDELRLYLQPKVLIGTGAACAAEALVRWQHPERGLVPPMDFIPFAEQTGFIRQLTLWMMEEVARQQAALSALGVACVSVNLSTRDLMDLELPAKLDTILRRHQAQAAGFCLEITESAIMDDPQRAEATLHRLAEAGFKLSIDDFGTGYSSLAYLKTLPVNELKIDKSFVMKMERNPDDAQIVRLVIDLAHNLKLTVVAEGVENEAILGLLHALHCDEAQGYHLSRPLPVPQFIDWVGRWRGSVPVAPAAPLLAAAGTVPATASWH